MSSSRPEVLAAVERIFREVFDDESLSVPETLVREDLPAWDSLGHIRLVGALEEAFGAAFTIEEIESMTSAARIVDVIAAKS